MRYYKAIKVIRVAKGLTQEELAEKMGMDATHLSRLEKNNRTASVGTLEKFCRATGVPMNLFMLLSGEPEDLQIISESQAESLGRMLLNLLINNKK